MKIVYVRLLATTKQLTSHFCTLGTTASVVADKERGGLIFVEIIGKLEQHGRISKLTGPGNSNWLTSKNVVVISTLELLSFG